MPEFSDVVDPRHAAVVVIDMQNDFCDPQHVPLSVPMLPRLKAFIAEARRAGVRILFVRVEHDLATDSEIWNNRKGRKPARKGTLGAEFHPDFVPAPGDYVLTKSRYSAFVRTNFEQDLHAMGIETLIMTGIATNVCVESTARDAFQRDFYVVMVEDCVAGINEAAHNGTITNSGVYGGGVTSAAEVLAAWPRIAVQA